MMETILNQFNTREIAIIFWLTLFVIFCSTKKSIWKSVSRLLKAFFNSKILSLLTFAILYTAFLIFFLAHFGVWNQTLLKDTIYWFVGVAFVLTLNANKANQEKNFFAKILKDNLKIVLIIGFIINFYTFGLIIEIILFFLLACIELLLAYTRANIDDRPEYRTVENILNCLLSLIIVTYFVFSLVKLFGNFSEIVTIENLRAFILPLILTVCFVPFVYCLALLMVYGPLFTRVRSRNQHQPSLVQFVKWRVFMLCRFNLSKLNDFVKQHTEDLMQAGNEAEVMEIIKNGKGRRLH